jgi:uncharacterized protein
VIHPHTELRFVSPEIGYGVFATEFIPKGTIVYIKDKLEIEIRPQSYLMLQDKYRKVIDKYSYTDERGTKIISWDIAKYVNHYCNRNTMSTGYSFEIAIRDIEAGEEITDEYGLLNIERDMMCGCGSNSCREVISANDIDRYHNEWDTHVKGALALLNDVNQPLMEFLDEKTERYLQRYLSTGKTYRSVYKLKYKTPESKVLAYK